MKKHFIELAMAVLMLVCFYILSWEAAETAGRLIDVSGNIKADQVILVDAGHGGMDFIMDSRLVYCLQNGLPLDMDVYDLAEWCCLAELGAISMDNGCAAVASRTSHEVNGT